MFELFVKKFPCSRKICEALVVYWLKCYFIIYLQATSLEMCHEQLPSMEKQLLWRLLIRTSHPEVICKTELWKLLQNSHNSTSAGTSFSINLQAIGQEHMLYGISPGDCFCQISFCWAIQKIFEKFTRKHPSKSLVLIIRETLDLKLY